MRLLLLLKCDVSCDKLVQRDRTTLDVYGLYTQFTELFPFVAVLGLTCKTILVQTLEATMFARQHQCQHILFGTWDCIVNAKLPP